MKKLHLLFSIHLALSATLVSGGPVPMSLKDTKEIVRPTDFFEDLIYSTLGLSVKQLLEKTFVTFEELNLMTTEGVAKLDEILSKASPAVKKELENIKKQYFYGILEKILRIFLGDLGNVLPNLSSTPIITRNAGPIQSFSAADIIRAILGKTLEVFVIAIKDALQKSSDTLTNVMIEFQEIVDKGARPEVAAALRVISEDYLYRGKSVVTPLLDDFRKLV